MGLSPERERCRKRLDAGSGPPSRLIPSAMDLAVMDAAERNRELVAHLAAERPRLREPQMMWHPRAGAHRQGTVAAKRTQYGPCRGAGAAPESTCALVDP